ncbi:MAG: nucleotidyl transferase AbiEii/AbiGii toxin family protein [Phycisphaeraceae bacterium]
MLTPLQRRLARLLTELPQARGFALAGGAALIARGLVDRGTRDLDFFSTSASAIAILVPALETRLAGEGLRVTRIRDVPGFVRLEVLAPDGERVEIDLSHDARQHPAEPTELGLTLSQDELAADKVLALFGRAEVRDFVDVAALLEVYPADRLLELAAAKDAGFSVNRFVEALAAVHRFDAADFTGTGAAFDQLVARFDAWRQHLAAPGNL